jgi:hypothetical protein
MTTKKMKEEHQKCCEAMRTLMQEGRDSGCNGPLPEKTALYMRLSIIQDVLEWCDSSLLEPGGLECATRIETLMSCSKYYGQGPTVTEMSKGR